MSRSNGKTRQTTMRLPENTIARLRKQAVVENRSVTNMAVTLIEEGLGRRSNKRGQVTADVLS